MTKPLYSALASKLYIVYKTRGGGLPRSIEEQGTFWVENYRKEQQEARFVNDALTLERGCKTNLGPDLIFVVDGSGSVSLRNFVRIKKFMKDVVSGFDISGKRTQIGLIKYSTRVKTEFSLNSYNKKKDVLKAIDRVSYQGGGTNTHAALNRVGDELKKEKGSREGRAKIVVVLTDGRSNHPALTAIAAARLHKKDVTIFAVGIGSKIDFEELRTMASDPYCLHATLLKDFEEVDSLRYAIEKRTCNAPIIINPGNNGVTLPGVLPPNTNQNCLIRVPQAGVTVKLQTEKTTTVYSFSSSVFPNEDYNDAVISAEPGKMATLYLPGNYKNVFCNIKGNNTNVTIDFLPGKQDFCRPNPCKNSGVCIDQGQDYICRCPDGFVGQNCQTGQ